MKLTNLHPRWFYRNNQIEGLVFVCPICSNGHSLMLTWIPPSLFDSGAVWNKSGDTFDNLSITPSIDATISGSCKFHGHITNGIVTWQ